MYRSLFSRTAKRLFATSLFTVPVVAYNFPHAFCADSEKATPLMPMVTMGGTGLVVSKLSFGFWATFGSKREEDVECVKQTLSTARRAGVNFFDNAETYGDPRGKAEEIMGQALEWLRGDENPESALWERSKIVITTKIFWGGDDINEMGVSRKHIKEGLDKSLTRMKLDYVDVVFAHRPDPLTSVEEIVRGFTQAIREGKAFYWGTSEWSAAEIVEAYWVAKMYDLIPPVVEQPQYNLFTRERFEKEYDILYRAPYNMGTTIWSPLASGVLTGKYNRGIPKGSRLDQKNYQFLLNSFEKEKAERIPKVEILMEIATRLDCSVTQLSIAWCAKNPNVSTVLLGSSKVWQLEENLASLKVLEKLTPEIMKEIEECMDNKPKMPWHYGRTL